MIADTDPEFTLESQSSYHGYDKLSAPNKCEIEIIVFSILINGTHKSHSFIFVQEDYFDFGNWTESLGLGVL